MFRLTPVVKNLIIINVALFLLEFIVRLPISSYLALWNVSHPNFQPYQLFTYMFVHSNSSIWHVGFNMLMLAMFGPILETFWGTNRFLLFYIIVGIGAAVFNILVAMFYGLGNFGVMLGASGAVYGVLTAFGMIFPNMELSLLFLPMFRIKAKYLVIILGAMAVYSGFSGQSDGIAHFTHLGGILVAVFLAYFWRSKGY